MRIPALCLAALLLLSGCSAPDYTAARDWARTASIAVDHPSAAAQATSRDGAEAMRDALSLTLAAIARMADDGVLPYPEDPFVALAARATAADARGGEAVASLGRTLRRATRSNWRAPQVRYAIRTMDPDVQALAAALVRVAGEETAYAALVRRIATDHATMAARAGDLTEDEMGRSLRAAEDSLRRGVAAMPRG
ncbi:hypothetical protein J5Y09_08980 [Roseomonas sp. PWR1]|uniref:Lipoprotein n=1 Tax=Roseomonas nitratireducens TaxID=2820810 RepID=A0ABS4ARR5_9PROT|nr:hypothetical protein [Neoroseomonas nitratireducens]MBP0464042.1 hypothetical protein [Neoroseomonas nitratireducens]